MTLGEVMAKVKVVMTKVKVRRLIWRRVGSFFGRGMTLEEVRVVMAKVKLGKLDKVATSDGERLVEKQF